MAFLSIKGQAFNQTRQVYLATALAFADTHWSRLRGLIGMTRDDFSNGRGLWIVPCHGVHSLGMSFPIDVVYLDRNWTVVHMASCLKPWRFAPIKRLAGSVLELPSETIRSTGTALGDKIEITLLERKH